MDRGARGDRRGGPAAGHLGPLIGDPPLAAAAVRSLVGAVDVGALHLPLAGTCLAVGLVVVGARRARRRVVGLLAVPLGAAVVAIVAGTSAGRGGALAVLVLVLAAIGGALVRLAGGSRHLPPVISRSAWVLAATCSWWVYLSVPDTEWAVAALGLLVPVAVVDLVATRSLPISRAGAELGAVTTLVVGAVVLGGAGRVDWSGWWAAKLAGAAIALAAVAVSSSERARPRLGRGPARRG